MLTKENFKKYVILISLSLLIYKLLDNPRIFMSAIKELFIFLSPFLIALFFVLILNPIVVYFENRFKLARPLSVLFSYSLVVLVAIFTFKLIIPTTISALNDMIKDIPSFMEFMSSTLEKKISKQEFFEATLPDIQQNLNTLLTRGVNLLTGISNDFVIHFFTITSIIFDIFIGIVLSIYILIDNDRICTSMKRLLYAILSKKRTDKIIEYSKMSHDILYHYFTGTLIESFIVGVIAFIGFLLLFKLDNSLFYGFIIFISNMIPYFGPFIGALFPMAAVVSYSPIKALWMALFIVIVQQLDGNYIAPKIIGNKVGLSPIWIISSIIIGGEILGIFGMIIAIPIAAIFKLLLDDFISKKLS